MGQDSRLVVLLAAGSLSVMAGAAIAPVLPELIQHLQLDPAIAGNVVSLHFLTLAISTPLLGVLADRVGKLRLLLVCLWFYGLFGVAGVGLQSLEGLLIIRGLLGVATGGVAAAGLGLLSCLYRGEERIRAIAYISSTITLANIVYPLLGGAAGSHPLAAGLWSVWVKSAPGLLDLWGVSPNQAAIAAPGAGGCGCCGSGPS